MKKIVITGHSGFIGRHLVQFLKDKYEIIGISKKNPLKKDLDIINIKKDVRKLNLNDLPSNFDCIIHLAGFTDVQYCQENPSKCFDVNIKGTQNMLEMARQKKSKFIFISTSHVYGIPKKLPISETHPTNPISIYAHSKSIGEILCKSYSENYHLDVSIARIFSVYGPLGPPHHVITKIIKHLINKRKLQLGNLFPKRDFIYIQDVISAIYAVIKRTGGFDVYNIGTGKSSSVNEVITNLTKITKKNIKIQTDVSKIRKFEIKEIRSDSSKIMSLGWKPKIELYKGLKMTVQQITNNQ